MNEFFKKYLYIFVLISIIMMLFFIFVPSGERGNVIKGVYALLCFMEAMMEEFAKNKNLKMIIFSYCSFEQRAE